MPCLIFLMNGLSTSCGSTIDDAIMTSAEPSMGTHHVIFAISSCFENGFASGAIAKTIGWPTTMGSFVSSIVTSTMDFFFAPPDVVFAPDAVFAPDDAFEPDVVFAPDDAFDFSP